MNQYKKVAFYTLGCKLNFAETSTIARNFEEGGYARVKFEEQPDVFVINTCSVTDNADKKCRYIVNKAKAINPNAFVTIIGCYAQLKPDEIIDIPGVNLVLGANEKFNILQHLDQLDLEGGKAVKYGDIDEVEVFHPSYSFGDRTRTFLKVQDGCDYNCSFCTIPLARGKSRSNSIESTLKVAREIAATDVKEVVLTGVNLGDFGRYNDESFFELIQELDKIEGIERYRISSIEPNLLSDEIIEFVAQSRKFVPHFHIPLQSGSPELLKTMRRRYKRDLYADRVKKIKALMPHCCIGVDVIVGFPGESDDHFRETQDFLIDLPVSYLHVFSYSERDNTKATEFGDIVPKKVRAQRSKQLQSLSSKKRRAFYQEHINNSFEVLWEAENNEGYLNGFTNNYIKVKAPYDASKINTLEKIQITKIDGDGLCLVDELNLHRL
jgi:threonylcarbamoyladenosine tRNA methylthiotransferase MtaB